MFYRIIEDRLYDYGDYRYEDDCKEVAGISVEDYLTDPLKYIVAGGELVLNANYEDDKAKAEAERISHLTCTKRVLALCLEEFGITYTKLKELIATDPIATLEWELCVELERNNPLLDIMGKELGITPQQIDTIFKFANGEVVKL